MATATTPSLRDGRTAIEYAIRSVGISASPNRLDTLACAYAAAGDFGAAIQTERVAKNLFDSGEFPAEVEVPDFSKQITLFSDKQSCAPPIPSPTKNFLSHTTSLIPN